MKAKFKKDNPWTGAVGNVHLVAGGRTKREAIKRLRKMFADHGLPTIKGTWGTGAPTLDPAFVDVLTNVHPVRSK
jgi:hypothetical protein